MSLEQAIITHANALLALAEASNRLAGSGAPLLLGHLGAQPIGTASVDGDKVTIKGNTAAEAAADEIPGKKSRTGKAETEEPTDAEKRELAGDPETSDEPALDYNKDVKPRLLAVVKKVGKEKVAELVASFGAKRADEIDPAKFSELLAKAEKLEK